MSTIPASEIVNVIPGVLTAGGSALDLNGLMLTTSIRPPIGSVQQFSDASSVSDFFGPSSDEAALAAIYFRGTTMLRLRPATFCLRNIPRWQWLLI